MFDSLRYWPQKFSTLSRTLSSTGRPHFASLFITRKCNLSCRYCRSYKNDGKDLIAETWYQIIDRLYDWGIRVFSLTGGEPLMRPDIFQIIKYISRQKKAVPWLISNFKLIDNNVLLKLKESGLNFLTGSLDSMDHNNKGASGGTLQKLTIAKSMGFFCSTITVITNKNIDEIKNITEAVTRRGILFDMGLYHNVGGIFSSKNSGLRVTDTNALQKLRRYLLRKKLLSGLISPSVSYLTKGFGHYDKMDWKCSFSDDSYIVVGTEGHLLACQEWPTNIGVLDIVNLEDKKWRQAKKRVVQKCQGCAYGCYYQKQHIHPLDLFYGLVGMMRS